MLGTDNGTNNWWSRPCGARDVLVLAMPLVISTASWTVMNFVDRMFLLWHSTRAMAAAMPAGMLYFSMLFCQQRTLFPERPPSAEHPL